MLPAGRHRAAHHIFIVDFRESGVYIQNVRPVLLLGQAFPENVVQIVVAQRFSREARLPP